MMFRLRILLIGILLQGMNYLHAQESSLRMRTFAATSDTLKLDSLTIYPNSFQLFCGQQKLTRDQYYLDYSRSRLVVFATCSDSLNVNYRVLPMDLSKVYGDRDTSVIYTRDKGDFEKFLINSNTESNNLFGGTSLNKSGSISRGISFGNNQDLSVNSTLNLELSGDIAPNLKLLASVSDDNLPIQPEGNTNKLQEFDQVFIQVYNDRMKIIAGDFWLRKPEGYFLTYKKRAQGLTVENTWKIDSTRQWKTQASGALSKGKFARQIIPGVEGNQGPYRLRGNENEPFIIVLSGTESVYIDGRLLSRGQEYDYVINYNTSEVVFTSRNQITKDSRIVIEFQYSDQNYARSLFQNSTTYTSDKTKFWFNAYSEQDAKNQPIQQNLSVKQKFQLSGIGDSLNKARSSSIDSIGYIDNQVLYKLVDSLGYDSVLVYSVSPESALYRAVFELVGSNMGNYVFSNFNALGRVYKWVAPVAGIPQGNYAASRLIVTPKQKQMVTAGLSYKIRKGLVLENEVAYTKNDVNTFSKLDRNDDVGKASRSRLLGTIPLGRGEVKSWELDTKVELELLDKQFNPIQQYRAVEFDRDWNTRNKGYSGAQTVSTLGANFKRFEKGNINIQGQHYSFGNDYQGIRTESNGKWNDNGFRAVWDASLLESKAENKNEFIRHRADISQNIKWFKLGYKDDHELNTYRSDDMPLSLNSYQFFDFQVYLANNDSTKNGYKVFYRERYDQRSDSTRLAPVAKARTTGGEIHITSMKNQSLNVITSYRELEVLNTKLLNQTPENTLLGRIDYELRAFNSALIWNNFYEVGSGLELKREFLYIKVNDGQGIYTWIDYNGDGIKDLNEFELAQYVDQASYIRVFTPSNEYVKTFSNELNQGVFWRPERIWASKKGILRLLSRFSDQARVRIQRKTNLFTSGEAFNPFATTIRDSNLLSTTTNLSNTLFINRTSSIAGGEITYQDVKTKTLLATGFDSRQSTYTEAVARWNIKRKFTIESRVQWGVKRADADYTSGRNYALNYYTVKPSLIYQPNTTFRLSLDGRYSEKNNAVELGGERSIVNELGSTFKYNQVEKGSLQGSFSALNIVYNGTQNSALGFEMLEALKPGINYTWNLGYQRSVSQNLQLSFQYNGRRSPGNKTIHSGGMEVRAFF
jgi:hypothetical protein